LPSKLFGFDGALRDVDGISFMMSSEFMGNFFPLPYDKSTLEKLLKNTSAQKYFSTFKTKYWEIFFSKIVSIVTNIF